MTSNSSAGASSPRVPALSGEGICVPVAAIQARTVDGFVALGNPLSSFSQHRLRNRDQLQVFAKNQHMPELLEGPAGLEIRYAESRTSSSPFEL